MSGRVCTAVTPTARSTFPETLLPGVSSHATSVRPSQATTLSRNLQVLIILN